LLFQAQSVESFLNHLSYGDYLDWKQRNRVFTSLDIYRPEGFALTAAAGLEDVTGAWVSAGFFRTLGIVPFLGAPDNSENNTQSNL
jgi:hypothetical protein